MAIASENLTKNQKTVLDILESSSEPLKAYTILFDIQKKGIKSPLQVYRALDKLIEIGKVHKIESRNAYIACKHEGCNAKTSTSFLICELCDKVTELKNNNLPTYFSKQADKNQNEQQGYHSKNANVQQQNNPSAEIKPKMESGTSSTSQAIRVKSEIQTEPGRVQVGVKGTLQGQEITKFFRVKTKIQCSRIIKSWCESHGVNQNPEDWQYIKYNGEEVDPSTTIAALGLKSLEILQVLKGEVIDIE